MWRLGRLGRRLFGRTPAAPQSHDESWYLNATSDQLIRDAMDNPDPVAAARSMREQRRRIDEAVIDSWRPALTTAREYLDSRRAERGR